MSRPKPTAGLVVVTIAISWSKISFAASLGTTVMSERTFSATSCGSPIRP